MGALLGTWRDLVSAKMCTQKESRGGSLLDYQGSMGVLDSTHVRGGDKRTASWDSFLGVVWNGFLLGKPRGDMFLAFVEVLMEMVTCSGIASMRHATRLIDGVMLYCPYALVQDGDLLRLVQHVIRGRSVGFIYASKVQGHADDVMARRQQVREIDSLGYHAADELADFGRRRCHCSVIDVWRNLSGLCGWYHPVIRDLQHFTIATSRAVVHDDGGGGNAVHPVVWCAGSVPKRRWTVRALRDRRWLPGPVPLWASDWFVLPRAMTTVDDVRHWPSSVGLVVKFSTFLGCLHPPLGGERPGCACVGGESGNGVHIWSCLSSMNFGLASAWFLRRRFPDGCVLDAQSQCRLFQWVQALIFGAPARFWVQGALRKFLPWNRC